MSEKRRQGKTGVFSYNPAQAMGWLITNKNVFTVMSYIILRRNFPEYSMREDLEFDEVSILFKDLKIKPNLTVSQWKRSLDNLWQFGFIEILEHQSVTGKKEKKIKILVDIYDSKIAKHVKDYKDKHGCYYYI